MSEQNSPEQELQPAAANIDRLGPVLTAAREKQGLSAEDVASRLRLGLRQVHALENDDFSVLPEAVITRGFIRNYARLLNIDAAPLLRVYSQYVPAQENQAISVPSANIVLSGEAGNISWRPYILFGVLLVVLLFGWVLYVDYFQKHAPDAGLPNGTIAEILGNTDIPLADTDGTSSALPQQSVPPVQADAPVTVQPTEPTDAPPAAQLSPQAAPAVPVTPAETPGAGEQPAAEGANLKFSVTSQTWISVSDGNGRQILNKTLLANSEETVTGKPPLRIIIGNTTGTKLEYNNSPVDLAPYTKVNVARLTLE